MQRRGGEGEGEGEKQGRRGEISIIETIVCMKIRGASSWKTNRAGTSIRFNTEIGTRGD